MAQSLSSKGQKTRQAIMEAAFSLFLERGTHATSVDDILKKSDKGKSQFYHYFRNKEDLIHALLQEYLSGMKSGAPPDNIEITSWKTLELWIETQIAFHRSLGKARGCLIGMIGQEATQEEELIRQDVQMIFDTKKDAAKRFFIGLKAQDKLINSACPDTMADLVLSVIQGSVLLVKVYQNEQILERNTKQLIHSLKSFDKTFLSN